MLRTGSNGPAPDISSSQRTDKLFAQIKLLDASQTERQKSTICLWKKPVFKFFESHRWFNKQF